MKIGYIVERAARIVWKHKVLAALGILDIILTSSGLFAQILSGLLNQLLPMVTGLSNQLAGQPISLVEPLVTLEQLGALYRLILPYGFVGWAVLIGGVLIVLIALAVVGLVIEGGVIRAVSDAIDDKPVTTRGVFSAGWRRILPMVIIASVPAIPLTVGLAVAVGIGTGMIQAAGGLAAMNTDPEIARRVILNLYLVAMVILCPMGMITLPLELLAVLSYQACILEEQDAASSFRRAWAVLRANPSSVLLLVVAGYVTNALVGAIAFLPALLMSVFLPVIVFIWLIRGLARTYYLALWPVGWREITATTQPAAR